MNNFFQPQAPSVPTIKNFESGQVYSANDVFRNLFRDDIQSTSIFGSNEEWELENELKSCINQMLFNRCYAIGSGDDEPNEELLKTFRKEVNEVVHFLLYNKEKSPLYEFKKTFRRFFETKEFCEDGLICERKGLNLEKLEEFLGIQISSEVAEYSDRFFLSGESGDWYMVEFGANANSSICFEETQIKSLARFIRRVLNVQESATERATMRFGEGFNATQVAEELTNAYGVERIVNKALEDCDMNKKTAVCFQLYGNWVVDFKSKNRHMSSSSEVLEFTDLQVAREYANARNESKKGDAQRKLNFERIAELKAEIAERFDLVAELDAQAEESQARLLKAEKLARPLQA